MRDRRFKAGAWVIPPQSWEGISPERLASRETLESVRAAVDGLPPPERAVIVMRDVWRLSSEEISRRLGVTAAEQRGLLHNARSMVRAALERHLTDEESELV